MTNNISDRIYMTETVHFSIPITNCQEDAAFCHESIAMSRLTVSEERKGFEESGSFVYQFQPGDTTRDDITGKTVIRSGHPNISMNRQYTPNKINANIINQVEDKRDYDTKGPILDVFHDSYHTSYVKSDPTGRHTIYGKDSVCPAQSLASGCPSVSNEVKILLRGNNKDPLENMKDEAITDQDSQPPLFHLDDNNDQVTLQTESATKAFTVTDCAGDAMPGPMFSSSDLNLFTRRHSYDLLDPCLILRNNQDTRPHSYHGPEIRNKSFSASGISIGSSPRKGYVRICQSCNFSAELSSNLTSSNRSLTSSKFSVISSKLETPGEGQVQSQHEELKVISTLKVFLSVTFTIISMLLFFADWVTDIMLARMYLIQQNLELFWFTVAFIIGPALVCAAVDLYWLYHDHSDNISDSCSQCAINNAVQKENEDDTRHESRVCMKYEFCSHIENGMSSGYKKNELLKKTRYKSQNSTRDTCQKIKQCFLEENTQNRSLDQSQEVVQGVYHTYREASSHGDGWDTLNPHGRENVQENMHDISSGYMRPKSQISTGNKSSDSELDQCSSTAQKSGERVQSMRQKCIHVSKECTKIKCQDDTQHFPAEISLEKLRINSHDKSVHSQDKTPVFPDIRCQMKINTFDLITMHHSACFRSSSVWMGFRIFIGILSFGRVFRSCEYVYHVIKNHQNGPNSMYHHLRALEEKRDYKLLDLVFAFTESAPQFFLQLYLVFMYNLPLETERALSLVTSLVGISWTVVSCYTHNKAALPEGRQLTLMAQVLIFLARLCEISARIISITLFETYFNFWSLVLIIHFIIMLLWIEKQNPSLEGVAYSKHFSVLFKLFFSYDLVICFLNLKNNKSKYRMVFYYVLTYGENFVFAGFVLWKVLNSWKGEEEGHYKIYWLSVIPIGFALHVMLQSLFYSCCHRK